MVGELLKQRLVQGQFLRPSGLVDVGDSGKIGQGKGYAGPLDLVIGRTQTEYIFHPLDPPFDAVYHPFQHPHVVAIAGPDKLAIIPFAEPVDTENSRQRRAVCCTALRHVQPVLKIVAHVVAAKGQHRKWVSPDHAHLAGRRSGGLRAHGGRHVDPLGPVPRLSDQGYRGGAPPAKNKGV